MRGPESAPIAARLAGLAILLSAGTLLLTGCAASRAPAPLPQVDAADAVRQALAEYDQNKDGVLDARELQRCPALRGAIARIDRDSDGRLSTRELEDRLASFLTGPISAFAFPCEVLLDGRPLAGATMTLVPEKFLGPAFKRASGTTDENGTVNLVLEGLQEDGVYPGYYRVEVSKKNAQGQETIPARFNTQTALGEEVAPDALGRGGQLVLRLSGK